MGNLLLQYKWGGLSAPFGTVFHPLALARLLEFIVKARDLDRDLYWDSDGAVFHHDLPSRFFARDQVSLNLQAREMAESVRQTLAQTPIVLLTLGSAFVYQLRTSSRVITNCHKRTSLDFSKRFLSAEEIIQSLRTLIELLPASSNVIISLSPVRHTRDGLIDNTVSKSLLRVAIHQLCQELQGRISYFPAYEIMMDDLRDYRFYESDLIHPNRQAIEYIWEVFQSAFFDRETRCFIQQWKTILAALAHRPKRADAPSYQQHLRSMLDLLESLNGVDVEQEKEEFVRRLVNVSA